MKKLNLQCQINHQRRKKTSFIQFCIPETSDKYIFAMLFVLGFQAVKAAFNSFNAAFDKLSK